MIDRLEITEGTDLLAAELALGFLEGEAHLAARHRQEQDPQFAHAVSQWQKVGQSWSRTETYAGADTVDWQPENLWHRVEASIGVSAASIERSAANDRGSSARGWRTGTIAASIATLVFSPVVAGMAR